VFLHGVPTRHHRRVGIASAAVYLHSLKRQNDIDATLELDCELSPDTVTNTLLVCQTQPVFREINSLGWYNDTVKNSSITTKHLYLISMFRSHHEIFIRRSWYSVLPSLDATISCRINKAVVGVTQLITALVASRLRRTEYQLLLMKIS